MDETLKNSQIFLRSKKVWENNCKLFPGTNLHYPDENLVRLFSGRYVPMPSPPVAVMDHGFGSGGNLVFIASKGYQCSGCEISQYFIRRVKKLFKAKGKAIDLRLVKDSTIPFKSESFEIVVSWNVIHYNGTRRAVKKVIKELYRVLKPGGVLLLSTISPQSTMLKRMVSLGKEPHLIKKKSKYDNRQGLTFFVAKSARELARLFDQFSVVKSGKVTSNLFDPLRRNSWLLIYAVK